MNSPVKVGIVGLGRWAKVLTRALADSEKLKIVAGYSRSLVNLDLQTYQVLPRYNIELADAKAGKSARPYSKPQN